MKKKSIVALLLALVLCLGLCACGGGTSTYCKLIFDDGTTEEFSTARELHEAYDSNISNQNKYNGAQVELVDQVTRVMDMGTYIEISTDDTEIDFDVNESTLDTLTTVSVDDMVKITGTLEWAGTFVFIDGETIEIIE